jgi:hypothetical protein
MQDRECLSRGLKTLGYKPNIAPNQTVRGDRSGDARKGYEVVLKKEDTKLRGDIGFKKDSNGNYEMGVDAYVVKLEADFLKTVRKAYTQAKIARTMDGLDMMRLGAPQTLANGKIRVQYAQRG